MMQLTSLSSIFELFCTFNLAYCLVDNFSSKINNGILSIYLNIKIQLTSLAIVEESIKQQFQEFLLNQRKKGGDGIYYNVNKPEQNRLYKEKIENFESQCNELRMYVEAQEKSDWLSKYFSYLCLFNALYCITILIFSALIDNNNHLTCMSGCVDAFLTFNLCSFILCVVVFICEVLEKPLKLSHIKAIAIYAIFILISLGVFIVIHNLNSLYTINHLKLNSLLDYLNVLYDKIVDKQTIYTIIVLTSLFIPASNFIFYFLSYYNKQNKESEMLSGKIKQLWLDYEGIKNGIKIENDHIEETVVSQENNPPK